MLAMGIPCAGRGTGVPCCGTRPAPGQSPGSNGQRLSFRRSLSFVPPSAMCFTHLRRVSADDATTIGWVNSRLLLSHTFMLLLTTPGFGAGSDGWRLPPGWRSRARRWAGFWTLFPSGLAPLSIWSVRRWTRVPGAGQRRTPAGPSMTWGLIDRLWHGGKYRYRTGPKGR